MRLFVLALVLSSAAAPAAPGGVVRVEHRDPAALPTRGPANALVTVELFFNPGVGSRAWYKAVEKLQAAHPTRIRLIYRVLKAPGIATLHYAALEAHAQGKFFDFMDKLNARSGALSIPVLVDTASAVGLDPDRFRAALIRPPAGYDKVLDANEHRRAQRIPNGQIPNALFNGRLPQATLNTMSATDFEREYLAAKDFAEELLDRGADPSTLAEAFDQETRPTPADPVVPVGDVDEPIDNLPAEPPLASPPLRLDGLPSLGPTSAQTTIVVLCSPSSAKCASSLTAAKTAHDNYPDQVRVVWGPYFDVERDDAADLSLLGDAALCAEKVGTTSEEGVESASSGWRWVEAIRNETTRRHRRYVADQVIDKTASHLGVDHRAFAACRAQMAGTTVAFVEAARHAGVRTAPSTIIGGRIYMSTLSDQKIVQRLVEAELAPGALGTWAPAWRRLPGAR